MRYEFVIPVWLETDAARLNRAMRSIRDHYDATIAIYADGPIRDDVRSVTREADRYMQFNRVKHIDGALWWWRIFNMFTLGEYDRHVKADPDIVIREHVDLDRGDVAGVYLHPRDARDGLRGTCVAFSPSAIRYIIRSKALIDERYRTWRYKRADRDEYYADGILGDVLRNFPFLAVVHLDELESAIIH
jgi:hypothetical protein